MPAGGMMIAPRLKLYVKACAYNAILWIVAGIALYTCTRYYDLSFALYNAVNLGLGFGWCISMTTSGSELFFLLASAYMLGGVFMLHQICNVFLDFISLEHNTKWYLFESSIYKKHSFSNKLSQLIKSSRILSVLVLLLAVIVIIGLWLGISVNNFTMGQTIYYIVSSLTGVGAMSIDPFLSSYWHLNITSIYSIVAVIVGNILISLLCKRFRISGTIRFTSQRIWELKSNRIDLAMLFPNVLSAVVSNKSNSNNSSNSSSSSSSSCGSSMESTNSSSSSSSNRFCITDQELQLLSLLGISSESSSAASAVSSLTSSSTTALSAMAIMSTMEGTSAAIDTAADGIDSNNNTTVNRSAALNASAASFLTSEGNNIHINNNASNSNLQVGNSGNRSNIANINDINKSINRQEFLILSAIRLGLISYKDVEHILETFDKLEFITSSGNVPSQSMKYTGDKLQSMKLFQRSST